MHVDDGNVYPLCPAFLAYLRAAIEARYDPLEWESEATSYTGFLIQRFNDGSRTVDQASHITCMPSNLGANKLPYVSKPILDDFSDLLT
jgi:hypothetical protein